jgi:hypothetical protein
VKPTRIYYHSPTVEAFADDGQLIIRRVTPSGRAAPFVLLQEPGEAETFCEAVSQWAKEARK